MSGMGAAIASVISLLLAACAGQAATRPTASPAPLSETTAAPASTAADGCGSTAVLRGGIPGWLDAAGGHNNPNSLRYVIAHPPLVAGFLFSDPLRAGHPENPSNKILWVVRTPRDGSQLIIDGHPLGAALPTVREARPADSSPGEIYPDGVDVPSAGCWQFELRWATSHVQVELNYVAP
ncbi:MAG TPA: hypothetical protein VGR77_03590 [Candidatus Dormibacteraeota bacterium]|nr:hypothetical protein [Candidatus Dormibacteraeota bacterium]